MEKLSFSFLAILVILNTLLAQGSNASNEMPQKSQKGNSVLISQPDLSCEMQMNPCIEEEIEAVLGLEGNTNFVNTSVNNSEVAKQNQLSIEFHAKGAVAHAAGKKEEAACWYNLGFVYSNAALQLEKVIKAEESGKLEVAQVWREVAEQNQLSVDSYTKGATTYAAGKKEEAYRWYNAGRGYHNAAEKLGKSIEAEINGNSQAAQAWREAAEQNQLSVRPYTKAVAASVARKENEGICWYDAGNGHYKVAEKLGKAIEAETNGKSEIAQAWRTAANLNQLSIEPYAKAAMVFSTERLNNIFSELVYADGDSVTEARDQFPTENEYINIPNAQGYRLYYAGKSYSNAAEKLEKAINAETNLNPEVVQAWCEVVKRSEVSGKFHLNGVVAHAAGKTSEGTSWDDAGYMYQLTAEQLEKFIETRTSNNIDLANKHQQAAGKLEQAANLMKQSAEAYADNHRTEGLHLYEEAKATLNALIETLASF